jgi:hypothetical protein
LFRRPPRRHCRILVIQGERGPISFLLLIMYVVGILSSLRHVLFRSRMHSPTMFVVVQSKYRNKSAGDDELVITSRSTSSFPSTRSLPTTKHPVSLTSASVHNRWYGYSHLGIPF